MASGPSLQLGLIRVALMLILHPIVPTDTNAATEVTIGVIGDYGSGGFNNTNSHLTREADVARLVKGWNPNFLITVGDNNYSAGSADTIDANIGQYYQEFIFPYQGSYGNGAVNNRFFPSLGNHDLGTSNGAPYLAYFTLPGNERYYNYRHGPVEVFALNSDFSEPDGYTNGSVQAQWLQDQLAISTAPWKVVYFHTPPYSSAFHGSSPWMQWPFGSWGASAVLSGHDHTYERVHVDGLPYFVNGLGGASIYEFYDPPVAGSHVRFNNDYGAMRINATDTNIMFEFVTRSNVVVDTYRIPQAPPGLPFFTRYPASQIVRPNSNIIFSATAGGLEPLSYRWQFNGADIPKATNAVLSVSEWCQHTGVRTPWLFPTTSLRSPAPWLHYRC
jgi:tartrate-resistant acid phosphatase type 5